MTDMFDAFSIDWIERSKNIMEYLLVNIALRPNEINFVGISKVEMKKNPSILDNIYN